MTYKKQVHTYVVSKLVVDNDLATDRSTATFSKDSTLTFEISLNSFLKYVQQYRENDNNCCCIKIEPITVLFKLKGLMYNSTPLRLDAPCVPRVSQATDATRHRRTMSSRDLENQSAFNAPSHLRGIFFLCSNISSILASQVSI